MRPVKGQDLLKSQELRVLANPIVALGVIFALLYWARVFFITSIIAVIIAFILEPFVGLLMRVRFPRSVASFVVCSMALMLLYLLWLGAYTQIAGLWDEMPRFSQRVNDVVEGARHKIDELENSTYRLIVPRQQPQAPPPPPPQQPVSRRKRNQEPVAQPQQGVPPGLQPVG